MIIYQGVELGVPWDVNTAPVCALPHNSIVLCWYPFPFFTSKIVYQDWDEWGAPRTGGVVNGGHVKLSITVVGGWSPYNCSFVTSKMSFYSCAVYLVCFLNLFGPFVWTQRLKCQCFKLDHVFKGRTQWLFSTYPFTINIWHCKTRRQINEKFT